PLVVDDAGTVVPGTGELEAGLYFESHSDVRHFDVPFGLTCGVARSLEVSLGFGGRIDQREEMFGGVRTHSSLGDLVLGLKWNPLSEINHGASHALALGVKFPTADAENGLGSGETDFDVTYIVSRNITDQWSVHLNLGYTFVGESAEDRDDDDFHSGVAVAYRITDTIELVAEIYSDVPTYHLEDSAATFAGGVRWNACEAVIIDAAIGTEVYGHAPEFLATAGFTWEFGLLPNRKNRD
ncbi:MAG: transporter, partial [Akkermansiaceae bacterium]|nr:transporter [Verrucomicrobiales bacterium]